MKTLITVLSLAIFLASLCGVAAYRSQSTSTATSASAFDRVFLTERLPVRTHSSVTGLPLGTALHVISTNGDTFRVTDGTQTFDVSNNKLTTDASGCWLGAE